MCVFAAPMLILYIVSIGVAYLVHPARATAKNRRPRPDSPTHFRRSVAACIALPLLHCALLRTVQRRKGARIRAAVGGLRPALSTAAPALLCAKNYLKKQFAHDNLQAIPSSASTPVGPTADDQLHRAFSRQEGRHHRAGHALRDQLPAAQHHFVGANDGAATTGLLLEIANHLRGHTLDGYSVWLVFFDGEEAVESGPHPTRSTAAGTWQRNGRWTARSRRSRPSCSPT